MNVKTIVSRLGGTSATAQLCRISAPSVSEWIARNRIPQAREMYLRAVRPDVFQEAGQQASEKEAA